jgi:hypothetical protein
MYETTDEPNPNLRLLTPRLQELGVDLVDNAARYPEMQAMHNGEYSEDDLECVKRVADHIRSLPLVHTTNSTPDALGGQIIPNDELDDPGHTKALDTDMGLSGFTFWNWGFVGHSQYGDKHIIKTLDEADTFWHDTVVTPVDIADIVGDVANLATPLAQQPEELQERIRTNYLDKMVSGEDWVQISACKMYDRLKQLREYGRPLYVPVTSGTFGLGEIKHHGPVSLEQTQFVDASTSETRDSFFPGYPEFADTYLLPLGFISGYDARALGPGGSFNHRSEEEHEAAQAKVAQTAAIWESILGWPPGARRWE